METFKGWGIFSNLQEAVLYAFTGFYLFLCKIHTSDGEFDMAQYFPLIFPQGHWHIMVWT